MYGLIVNTRPMVVDPSYLGGLLYIVDLSNLTNKGKMASEEQNTDSSCRSYPRLYSALYDPLKLPFKLVLIGLIHNKSNWFR